MLRDTNGRDLISGCSHSCILSVRLWIQFNDRLVCPQRVFPKSLSVSVKITIPFHLDGQCKGQPVFDVLFGQKWFDFQFASDSAPSSGLQIILNRLIGNGFLPILVFFVFIQTIRNIFSQKHRLFLSLVRLSAAGCLETTSSWVWCCSGDDILECPPTSNSVRETFNSFMISIVRNPCLASSWICFRVTFPIWVLNPNFHFWMTRFWNSTINQWITGY